MGRYNDRIRALGGNKRGKRKFLRLFTNVKRSVNYHGLSNYARCLLYELIDRYTGMREQFLHELKRDETISRPATRNEPKAETKPRPRSPEVIAADAKLAATKARRAEAARTARMSVTELTDHLNAQHAKKEQRRIELAKIRGQS